MIVNPDDLQQVFGSTHQLRPLNQPGNRTVIAVLTTGGVNGLVGYSDDGRNFFTADTPPPDDNFDKRGAWGHRRFYLVTNNSGVDGWKIYSSADRGRNWSEIFQFSGNQSGLAIAHSPSLKRTVCVGRLGFATCDDGETFNYEAWTANHSTSFQLRPEALIWVEELGLYVCAAVYVGTGGSDAQEVYTSPDGENWTLRTAGSGTTSLVDVTFAPVSFSATHRLGALNTSFPTFWLSIGGASWGPYNQLEVGYNNLTFMANIDRILITAGNNNIYYSDNIFVTEVAQAFGGLFQARHAMYSYIYKKVFLSGNASDLGTGARIQYSETGLPGSYSDCVLNGAIANNANNGNLYVVAEQSDTKY